MGGSLVNPVNTNNFFLMSFPALVVTCARIFANSVQKNVLHTAWITASAVLRLVLIAPQHMWPHSETHTPLQVSKNVGKRCVAVRCAVLSEEQVAIGCACTGRLLPGFAVMRRIPPEVLHQVIGHINGGRIVVFELHISRRPKLEVDLCLQKRVTSNSTLACALNKRHKPGTYSLALSPTEC